MSAEQESRQDTQVRWTGGARGLALSAPASVSERHSASYQLLLPPLHNTYHRSVRHTIRVHNAQYHCKISLQCLHLHLQFMQFPCLAKSQFAKRTDWTCDSARGLM